MTDRVQIQITATDGASRVFQGVASSADKMGKSIENAGKSSKSFRDQFEQNARAAEEANRQYEASDRVMRDMAISAGIVVTGMGLATRSYRDQQIALNTLERSYGSASDDMVAFSETIQDTTNFSNDAAVASANIAATLARNYGLSAEEIQRVLTISADLAATSGLNLVETTQRVVAALRGEAESAEILGLTMNQAAIDSQNLTLSMTNEEAARFRLNALYEQAAFAQGAAGEQAQGLYGQLTQLRDVTQDMAQSIGGSLGPLGEFGAFAADNAVQIGLMSASLVQLASTAKAANVAMAGTKLAMVPPALLGIAAALGAVYIGYEALTQQGNVTTQGLEDLRENAASVEEVLTGLAAAGESVAMSLGVEAHAALSTMASDIELMLRLSGERATAQPGRMDEAARATHEAHMARLAELEAQYGSWVISAEEVAAAEADLQAVLTNSGTGRELALQGLARLNAEFEKGAISPETYVSGLENIADSLTAYDMAANRAAEGTDKLTEAQKAYRMELAIANQTLEQYQQNQQIGGQNLASEHRETAAAIEEENEAREHGINTAQVWMDVEQRMAANAVANAGAVNANISMYETMSQAHALRAQQVRDEAIAVEKLKTAYVANFEAMQAHATQASDTLDTVFGAIVGNTNAIADNAQGVADWSTGLLEAGLSAENYGTALESNTRILAANASIQEDVLSIQAQLSPIVATATEALAEQLDVLEGADTDAQLFAIGMMDAATSSQALALATGYLENQDVFGPMIQQAAELNPMLAQILEEMGLISYNPATGVVELLGAEDAVSDLDQLTAALDRLTMITWMATLDVDATAAEAAFEEATGQAVDWDNNESEATLNADNSGAIGATDEAITRAGYFDNYTATADINVNDNASGTIAGAIQLLNSLDGASATSYITTVVQTINQTIGGSAIFGRNGGVMSFANGGVAQLAEAGPEMLHFRDGGTAMAWNRGYYNIPDGTYVDTAPATAHKLAGGGIGVTININGPASWDDAAEQVSRKIVPAIQRAMREHERSLGGY
jgi:hypothetical protein